MISLNWDIIVSILTALGIFEIIKRVLVFSLENTVIKRNLEIRDIAERAMDYLHWLKLRNFEEPLSIEDRGKLTLDLLKIEDFDKSLADDLMKLVNYPMMIKIIHENDPNSKESYKLINDYHKELHSIADNLNKKLNILRYKPIIKIWKISL